MSFYLDKSTFARKYSIFIISMAILDYLKTKVFTLSSSNKLTYYQRLYKVNEIQVVLYLKILLCMWLNVILGARAKIIACV